MTQTHYEFDKRRLSANTKNENIFKMTDEIVTKFLDGKSRKISPQNISTKRSALNIMNKENNNE